MTNIKFRCPDCGKKLSAPENSVGRQSSCPKCGAKFTVPTSEQASRRAKQAASDGLATEHALLLMPSASAHQEDLIDMTAMVDIVFFLLIFFLVTSMQSLESVINLPSPQASSTTSAISQPTDYLNDPSFIVVTIDEEDVIWVDDEEVYGEQSLRSKLRAARKDEDRTGLLVIGDPDATHGTLVGVLDAGADGSDPFERL
jgi:biopolymer transport protein ExbD